MIQPTRASKQSVLWRDLILIFAVALLARAGWCLLRHYSASDRAALEFPDERQYWFMASSLASGEGLRDDMGFRATRMPLYPAFLSLFADSAKDSGGLQWAKASQWLLGALAAPLIGLLGGHLGGRRAGLVAGFLVAFDPFFIFFSSLLLTETLAITALCALWLALALIVFCVERVTPWNWLAVAICAIACVYLRESNLGLVLLGMALVLLVHRSPAATAGALATIVILAASLVPWAARNRHALGEWCWLTTRAGISLYDGVGPQATGASDLAPIQRTGQAATLSELEWDRHFKEKAWMAIRDDPMRVLNLAGRKLARMWNPFPNVETYRSGLARWVSALWTIPLFVFAIISAIRWIKGHAEQGVVIVLFLLLPAIYFSVLHSVYVGSVRYRLPAIPMIVVLAALSVSYSPFPKSMDDELEAQT